MNDANSSASPVRDPDLASKGSRITRDDVFFRSGDGTCAAWLYLPPEQPGHRRPPVIVMAHGVGGVKEMRLDAFAERFCSAGYACLVFDYRYFGASDGAPRQLLDRHEQLRDWTAAIACARSLTRVDTSRVVLWGTSFSGGLVLHAAADDGNIQAVIAQCPFTDGRASVGVSSLRSTAKVSARAIADVIGSRTGRPMITAPSAGLPGSASLMSSPGSLDGYLALTGDSPSFRNYVGARAALQILRYTPGRYAKQLRCPLYVAVCAYDTVAPPQATRRHTSRAPDSRIVTYLLGHFDVYVGHGFDQVCEGYLGFLAEKLPPDANHEQT